MATGHTMGLKKRPQFSLTPASCLSIYSSPPPPNIVSHAGTHTLTFVITVITKRWNEVIFCLQVTDCQTQQMMRLAPAMQTRRIIFTFLFILAVKAAVLWGCQSGNCFRSTVFAIRRSEALPHVVRRGLLPSVSATVWRICGWITFRWVFAVCVYGMCIRGVKLGRGGGGPPVELRDLPKFHIISFLVFFLLLAASAWLAATV